MSKDPSRLSLRLCHILDKVGASEKIRQLHRHAGINREIMSTLEYDLRSFDLTSYVFGSFCEGTTTQGLRSDMDVLESYDRMHVIEQLEDAKIFGSSLLISRDEETHPGYVKFRVVGYGIPTLARFGEINLALCDVDHTGRVYKKHISGDQLRYSERNGPAFTYYYESGLSLDTVRAMSSKFIPQIANSFLIKRRPYNWPTKENIDTMSRLGCFYVGVCHPNSPDNTTEWRLSFSRQERMLMFSLNEKKHKCYILLKIIKKEIIEAETGKTLSSYHCKTCLFHVIENTPTALWRPENLCQCVLLCLVTLYQWTHRRYCPNFFVREENMFDRKIIKAKKAALLETLWNVISDRYICFLKIKTDRIGEFLMQRGTYLEPSGRSNTFKHMCTLFCRTIEPVIQTDPRKYNVNALGVQSGIHHPALIDITILDWITNITCVRGHNETETMTFLSYLKPLLHLNLAQSLISLWFNANSRQTSVQLIKAFDFHFEKAKGHSNVTINLVMSAILYRIGKYEDCRRLLEQVEENFTPSIAPVCVCQDKLSESNWLIWKTFFTDNAPFSLFIQNATALCVQFVKSDLEIIPVALRYEMFRSIDVQEEFRDRKHDYWYDFAVVDARVFLHFLQYLVFSTLKATSQKNSAINKLRGTVFLKENLGHKETACNLLGWIYVQEGDFSEAVEWFVISWKLRPGHNAAKWHVRQLMTRLLKGRLTTAVQQ